MKTALALSAMLTLVQASSLIPENEIPGPKVHKQYGVADWRQGASIKRSDYVLYRRAVLNDASISVEEKVERIVSRRDKIRSDFVRKREQSYGKVTKTFSVGHSCTKGSSGGTKKCGNKCKSSGDSDLYTKGQWGNRWSKDTDARAGDLPNIATPKGNAVGFVHNNGQKICTVKLQKSGRGRKAALTRSVFRLRPASISKFVEKEANAFAAFVISTND